MSSIREALEAAFDEHAEETPDGGVQEREEKPAKVTPNDGAGANDGAGDNVEAIAKERPAKAVKSVANEPPGTKESSPPAQQTATTGQAPTVAQQGNAQAIRAPVSWRPELREKFGALPPEVQAEVNRRENEINQGMRQTAEARQYAGRLQQIVQPYEAMIRAEGGDHFTAVDSLLKTAYHLRTAPPQVKAQMVAQMIRQHAVDINMLDQALSGLVKGQQQAPVNDPMMAYLQQELAPMKQFFNQAQQRIHQSSQQATQEAAQSIEQFASDPKNEFFEDVRGIMADIIDQHQRVGQQISLSDAYTRATLAHPTIAPLVMNRQMTANAAQRSKAATRARNASASLPSGGAPAGAADSQVTRPKSVRSAIEAAWEQVEERDTN